MRPGVKQVGEKMEGEEIRVLMFDGDAPVVVPIAVAPSTYLQPDGSRVPGVAIVFAFAPDHPILLLTDGGARTLLAELLRHVQPSEAL